jgi:hypothetical protein
MNAVTSLMDFILNLLKDPQAQAEFHANPDQVLASHGLTGVCAADIHETLPLVTDNRSVELTSSHSSTPPPASPQPGESDHAAAVRYLSYITNTYTYDNHSTSIDDSVHENIWAAGDVTQTFDDSNVVAAGQGSVAAGGAISGSTVTTGAGDAVGTGAAAGTGNVTGNENALGTGSAAGEGNAVANGAGSTIGDGNDVANGSHATSGEGNVTGSVSGSQVGTTGGTSSNDASNHSVNDSGNTDLHSYGSGATNTLGDGNSSSAATNSGNSSDTHSVSDSGNTTDSGNTADTSSSTTTDDNSLHVSGTELGNTYGQDSGHDASDSHDAGLHLGIH